MKFRTAFFSILFSKLGGFAIIRRFFLSRSSDYEKTIRPVLELAMKEEGLESLSLDDLTRSFCGLIRLLKPSILSHLGLIATFMEGDNAKAVLEAHQPYEYLAFLSAL